MSLDLDKIKEYTGINAESNEEFIEQFSKKYYTKDQIFKDPDVNKEFFGRAFGSATTAVKQIFEKAGIEITGDDLKQPIEKVVENGISQLNGHFSKQREELERTAGLTADEKIKEYAEKYSKLENKNKDLNELLKSKSTEFEELAKGFSEKLKNEKLQFIRKDVHSAIQWNPDKDEFSKKGFLTAMDEKYVITLDENDEPYIANKSDGSRIKAEGTHANFMSPAEVYKMEALKSGMAAVNPKAGKKPEDRRPTPINNNPNNQNPNNNRQPASRPMANTRWQPGQ